MQINLYQYFQILSLVVALICFRGLRAYALLGFIPFLIVSNTIEIIARNRVFFGWDNNYFIYNIYLLLATPIQLYLFGKMLRLRQNERPVFLSICLLCMLIVILNYCFLQGPARFNTISLILIEIVSIVLSCFVLLRITVQQDTDASLLRDPYFWINAGNLLFALVTLVVLGLQQYIRSNQIELGKRSLYLAIMPGVNIVAYSAYTYAFLLCMKQKHK